jgi:hypothetical protein
MYCENCGSFIQDGEAFCSNCGSAVKAAPVGEPAPAPGPESVQPAPIEPIVAQPYTQAQPVQPVYQQPVYQQPAYQQPAYQQPVMITPFEQPKRNTFATLGMIFGIVTAATYWTSIFNMIPGICAIIFSIIGLTKKDCGGKGKCVAGFITAGVGIVLGILVLVAAIYSDN